MKRKPENFETFGHENTNRSKIPRHRGSFSELTPFDRHTQKLLIRGYGAPFFDTSQRRNSSDRNGHHHKSSCSSCPSHHEWSIGNVLEKSVKYVRCYYFRFLQPMVRATLIVPEKYMKRVLNLCQESDGVQEEVSYLGNGDRAMLVYRFALNQIMADFYSKVFVSLVMFSTTKNDFEMSFAEEMSFFCCAVHFLHRKL